MITQVFCKEKTNIKKEKKTLAKYNIIFLSFENLHFEGGRVANLNNATGYSLKMGLFSTIPEVNIQFVRIALRVMERLNGA